MEDIGRWHEAMPDLNEIHLPYTTKKEVFEIHQIIWRIEMYIHILHFGLEEFYETHQNKKSAQVFKMWKMYQIEGKDFRKQQCMFEQGIEEKVQETCEQAIIGQRNI